MSWVIFYFLGVPIRGRQRPVMSDDSRAGRLDPFSVVVDAGVSADGAYDVAGRNNLDLARVLEDSFEGETEMPFALGPEAGGMGMAVNGVAAGEAVFVGDNVRAVPLEESRLDVAALRVAADTALARVAARICVASFAVAGGPFLCFVGFCGCSAHAPR